MGRWVGVRVKEREAAMVGAPWLRRVCSPDPWVCAWPGGRPVWSP